MEHPTEGAIRLLGFPSASSAEAMALTRLPPTLGQHSRETLAEAGVAESELDALVRSGAVIDGAVAGQHAPS